MLRVSVPIERSSVNLAKSFVFLKQAIDLGLNRFTFFAQRSVVGHRLYLLVPV